jgi:putative hemolysin
LKGGNEVLDFLLTIIIVLLCLASEAFFSGSEIAIVSSDKIRLKNKSEEGLRSAKLVEKMLEKPEYLLATTLVGTNLSLVINTVVATSTMIYLFGAKGELYSLILMSLLVLNFGEILPKTIFQHYADKLSLRVIYPIRFMSYLFYPVIFILTRITNFIITFTHGEISSKNPFVTKEELEHIVRTGVKKGSDIKGEEKKMIKKIFSFSDTTVKETMVPLVDIVALRETSLVEDVVNIAEKFGYSRIPIYSEKIYNIIGIINVYDVLLLPKEEKKISNIIRPAYYVPESKRIDDLLKEFQREGLQLAVVVDEYGGTIGIVTLEDLLEEIVGEIHDEYDSEKILYERLADGSCLIDARMEIDAINERLGFNLPKGDYETLGGFVIDYLQRIPKIGRIIKYEDLSLKIEDASYRRVKSIKISRNKEG